jgi:hypothetical protein
MSETCRPSSLDRSRQGDVPMLSSEELTLLDLVEAMSEVAANDQEMPAVVADFIDCDQARFCANADGATIDLLATMDTAA